MTSKEFFEMNVGDEFEICFGEYRGKYIVNAIYIDPDPRKTLVCVSKGCCGYNIINDFSHFNWLFISYAQKLPPKTPVEKVQEKIDVLKLELSKLEAEKKSLEIQAGHFYEIVYKNYHNDGHINFICYVTETNDSEIYILKPKQISQKYIKISDIISFKRILDISVIEEAWKNV